MKKRSPKPSQNKKNTSNKKEAPKRKPNSKRNAKPKKMVADDNSVRLNKFLANAGICSRREADKLIQAGAVTINGKVVTELGTKVLPTDKVNFGGESIQSERMVYVVMNKPKDFLTTVDDPYKRRTVLQLLANKIKERIYPVGRLDRYATGVLLFTNDGDLTRKLTHVKQPVKRIYQITTEKNVAAGDLRKMTDGIRTEKGGTLIADDASYTDNGNNKKVIGVEMSLGKDKAIRDLFEALDYKVIKLDRVLYAGLTKKNLDRGKWRKLDEKEVRMLKTMAFNK